MHLMKNRSSCLDRIRIASPCSTDWDLMTGDEQVRFCTQCNKHVYNISKMTRSQAEAVILSTGGKVCAKFERSPDGSIVTQGEQAGLHSTKRHVSPITTVVMAAALGLSPNALAGNASHPIAPASGYSESIDKEARSPVPLQETGTELLVTVYDTNGAVILGAKVIITNAGTQEVRTGITSDEGECRFKSLQAGPYTIKIEAMGFRMFTKTGLALNSGSSVHFGTTLEVGTMGEIILLEGEIKPTPVPESLLVRLNPFKKLRKSGRR